MQQDQRHYICSININICWDKCFYTISVDNLLSVKEQPRIHKAGCRRHLQADTGTADTKNIFSCDFTQTSHQKTATFLILCTQKYFNNFRYFKAFAPNSMCVNDKYRCNKLRVCSSTSIINVHALVNISPVPGSMGAAGGSQEKSCCLHTVRCIQSCQNLLLGRESYHHLPSGLSVGQ